MKNKQESDTAVLDPSPILESTDELQKQLDELQKKFNKALADEEQEAVDLLDMPIADIMLKVGHGIQFAKKGMTPPEVAILAAMHHMSVGGNPISEIRPTGTVKVDPMDLRRHLAAKYSKEKVMALFPGPVPNFPTKFIRAVKIGLDTGIAPERLFDYHVQPQMAGQGGD